MANRAMLPVLLVCAILTVSYTIIRMSVNSPLSNSVFAIRKSLSDSKFAVWQTTKLNQLTSHNSTIRPSRTTSDSKSSMKDPGTTGKEHIRLRNNPPLILLYHPLHRSPSWWFKNDSTDFTNCKYECQLTRDLAKFDQADMVLFENPRFIKINTSGTLMLQFFDHVGEWPKRRGNSDQVWTFFAREPQQSGLSGVGLGFARFSFNYTVTFQREADLFYPYGHIDSLTTSLKTIPDYSVGRTKQILWIVSNCYAKARMNYYEELRKHISIEMVGRCNKTHGDPCQRDYKCTMKMKSQFKFYLAFENHQCRDYITEKFWKALNEFLIPVVMGPSKSSYERVAPPNSFIHVSDFVTPKALADHLQKIDEDKKLFMKYHEWRKNYKVAYNSANCGMCRLATEKPKQIADITKRWNSAMQCW